MDISPCFYDVALDDASVFVGHILRDDGGIEPRSADSWSNSSLNPLPSTTPAS